MTAIPHDLHPDLQALVRQCGSFDKISLELWTAWDRANAEWQERRRAGLKTPPTFGTAWSDNHRRGLSASDAAAKSATTSIPIVFASGSDPVEAGLVASLNRPGGNVTGVNLFGGILASKQLELLRELVPKGDLIAVLVNPANSNAEINVKELQSAALRVSQRIEVVHASSDHEFNKALATLTQLSRRAFRQSRYIVARSPRSTRRVGSTTQRADHLYTSGSSSMQAT